PCAGVGVKPIFKSMDFPPPPAPLPPFPQNFLKQTQRLLFEVCSHNGSTKKLSQRKGSAFKNGIAPIEKLFYDESYGLSGFDASFVPKYQDTMKGSRKSFLGREKSGPESVSGLRWLGCKESHGRQY
ncbi:MAG: hypothetical protein AB1921_02645, partial [Thermodesulfobacteriota bacterium]